MTINRTEKVIQWNVDMCKYNTRPINRVFNRATEELKCLILNFCLNAEIAIPMSINNYSQLGVSYRKARRALEILSAGGWVQMALNYRTDVHRARIWKRTPKFESTFRMRVGAKLLVKEEALLTPTKLNGVPINLTPGLEIYSTLAAGVRISMADGSQVFRKLILYRKDDKRIYAAGACEYQNMKREERPKLLINGEPTVELDFPSMHANLLLNREHKPCCLRVYEAVMGELNVEVTPERRRAVKLLVNASFNLKNVRALAALTREDEGKELIECLGVTPTALKAAICRAHPALSKYVCTGLHWEWLQETDSNIIIQVLETLAKRGIIGLPEHDSVIVAAKYRGVAVEVMEGCYRELMGFSIRVK